MKNETVLCIRRNQLPDLWVKKTCILPLSLNDFSSHCSKADFKFISRTMAETNPEYKQIIPYIALQSADCEKTAIYLRKGSEKRLHDLWSIGIGGHINPIDAVSNKTSFKKILTAGMKRELDEELRCRPRNEKPEFLGIISEEITQVGRVHMGAVFRILTLSPNAFLPGDELSRFQWMNTQNLDQLNLELWSELSLKLISMDR